MNLEDYLSMLQKMAEQERKRKAKLGDDSSSSADQHDTSGLP